MKPALEYPFLAVILTTRNVGAPHLDALRESNPGLNIRIHESADADTEEGAKDAWRNCDRNIRQWWQREGKSVEAEQVLFLEYDVLVTVDLVAALRVMPAGFGMMGASVKGIATDGRAWAPFAEARRLPREVAAFASGIAPLAVAMISRGALDAISDDRWNETFAADIFCELRLPTLIRACGYRLMASPMPFVKCGKFAGKIDAPGLYHGVKP